MNKKINYLLSEKLLNEVVGGVVRSQYPGPLLEELEEQGHSFRLAKERALESGEWNNGLYRLSMSAVYMHEMEMVVARIIELRNRTSDVCEGFRARFGNDDTSLEGFSPLLQFKIKIAKNLDMEYGMAMERASQILEETRQEMI